MLLHRKQIQFFLCLFLPCLISSSPFELTAQYVQNFKNSIDEFKKQANNYQQLVENYPKNLTVEYQVPIKYDFIIIGAGASGSVVANRLSEVPEWKVLLLEAGGPETDVTKVPNLGRYLQASTYNWGYLTTPQNYSCLGMLNHQCAIAGGRSLGGSTAINGMMYTRGNAKDYDQWYHQNNTGWSFEDLLPYFKKAEDANFAKFDQKYHSHGGPFHIEHPQYLTTIAKELISAGKQIGLDEIDYNGKEQLGLGLIQINTKNGVRLSTASAYLVPASNRPNLKVMTLSHVTKLIINKNKIVQGVEFLHEGQLKFARAEKEVVLSAGALNTPQILMLSGIGPAKQLDKFEIPLIKELQVGTHLKDHFGFLGLNFIFNKQQDTQNEEIDEVVNYLKNAKGPLTSPGIEVIAYVQTNQSKENHYPDIELFFVPKIATNSKKRNIFNLKPETIDSVTKSINDKMILNIGVMLAHPKSTGSVQLNDKDPLHRPLVNSNQLTDDKNDDLATFVAGIRYAIKLINETNLSKQLAINTDKVYGCETYDFDSDEYWACAVRHYATSLRHVTGTARMGPNTDPNAIVNEKLQVYDIEKLRIIDASVIPVSITGHTMAPSIMIGEKGSDLIKASWSL